MSGMPNKACTFPGTTKNLHVFSSLLCSMFTLHMPHCVIIFKFYVFNLMFLILVTTNCSFVAKGNNLLYKCKGIMFQSLPVSTLYGTIIETGFDNVFIFAVTTDHLLLKIIDFIFTMSIRSSWCWSGSCSRSWAVLFLPLLQTSLSGWPCHIQHASSHRLGNVWVEGWNHNICNSALWVFWHVFVVFWDCVSVSLLLSLSCQTPLFCLVWLLLWTRLLGLSLSLPRLILVHLLQLYFPQLWWVLLLLLLAYLCHWVFVWIAPSIVYLFIVTLYSCQFQSVHPFFGIFICLSA